MPVTERQWQYTTGRRSFARVTDLPDQTDRPHPRMDELAGLYDACRTVFLQVSNDSHWRPAPGSPASMSQKFLTTMDTHPSSVALCAGFDLVTEATVTFLDIGAGHLEGLAALHRAGTVMFPAAPLARAVLENSAHSMWVIGAGDGPQEQLARAYLEEFKSAEMAKMAAVRMGSRTDQVYVDAAKRWQTVRTRALIVFPASSKETLDNDELGGQKLLGPQACVEWMYEQLRAGGGSTVDARQAKGIYDFLSSGTHPTLYQARQLREFVDHGDHYGARLTIEIGFLERMAAVVVVAFQAALSYAMSFYGLDLERHTQLMQHFDDVLPGVLR